MLDLFRRSSRERLALAWDHDGIVLSLGERYVVTFGWDSISRVRGWRQNGELTMAIDLAGAVGSVCLDNPSEIEQIDEFENECCARLPGWLRHWRAEIGERSTEVVVWKRER
jgi:hypothetical protein